jgi:type I restriction enzyme, S subunit
LPSISFDKAKKYSFIINGDLLMADASEDYSGICKSVEVVNVSKQKMISGLHTFLLRDTNKTFVDGFRGYINSSKLVKSQFDRLATGLKVYGVSKANLKLVKIPVPPLPEQQAIAAILSDMDAEIEKLEQQRDKYKAIKQGMMQELLTGKTRLV